MRLPFIQTASWQTSKQLRSELQAERSTLVGHSWGAMLALLYGTTYPEQVERLLLMGFGPLSDEMDRVARANLMKPRLRSLHALRKDFEDSRFSSRSRQRNVQYDLKDWQEKLTRRQALLSVVEAEGLEAAKALGAQLYDLCQPHFEVYSQKVQIGQLYGLPVCYEGEVVEEREAQDVRNFWGAAPEAGEEAGQSQVKKEVKVSRRVILESDTYQIRASFALRIGENRAENNAGVLRHTFGKELPAQAREAEAAIRECQQKLVQLEKILAEPFTYDAEIAEIETRLLQLDREIKAELEEDVEVEFA